ncbi:MAG: beta-ketoacyl-[acyl-carrier-protein] synthase family protein [Thermoanaerobaculales bacterium]
MSGKASRRRVAVTGYGLITPLGGNAEETFTRAAEGRSGIDWITSFDTRGLPVRIAGCVTDDRLADADGRLDRLGGRAIRLMEVAAGEAARAAALDDVADRRRVAMTLGFHGANPTVEEIVLLHRCADGNGHWDGGQLAQTGGYDAQQFARRKPDVGAALLAARFACHGPNLSLVSACAAGAQAIGEAFRLIGEERCDAVLAGGCDAMVDFMGVLGFTLLRALSERFESPARASRPFDRKRNGFVLAEGAAAVVLEALDHARARGAAVLGEVLGYGDSADAYRITDASPDGEGARVAMERALEDAGLFAADVEHVNAHATSTVQGDIAEAQAIRKLLGPRVGLVPVSANKSMLGHAIGAAGAIECVLTLIGMQRSLILPTINYETPDPRCALEVVPNQAREQAHRVSLSNSFGFGGQNACLCLGRYDG